MDLLGAEFLQDIVVLSSDTQHIDIELAAESRLEDSPVDH